MQGWLSNKTSTPQGIFIVTPSLQELQTKAKMAPSPHEVRLILLSFNSVFQCLNEQGKILRNKR